MKRAIPLVGAAVVAALAGGVNPLAAIGAQPAGATHTVVIEGMAYTPAKLSVKAGDTVEWVNRDLFPHTATAADRTFDSREIAAGASWRYVVKKRGELGYLCTLHPTMKATLLVE